MRTVGDFLIDREVYSVQVGQSVKDVVDYLCERRIGAVPVMDGEEVVGIFSERDLMHRVVHKGLDPSAVKVQEVMSKGCIRISPDEDHRIAKAHMFDRHVRHLVVMDENDRLCGIVSMRHLIEMDVEEYAELVSRLNDKYYQSALKGMGKSEA